MKLDRERGRWAMCFGVLGAMVIAGALVSTPQAAEAQRRPTTPDGVAQFNRACGRCHPHGDEDTGPDLHNLNKTEEEVTKVIRNGYKHMKAIPPAKLSNADLSKVMIFLRHIRTVH